MGINSHIYIWTIIVLYMYYVYYDIVYFNLLSNIFHLNWIARLLAYELWCLWKNILVCWNIGKFRYIDIEKKYWKYWLYRKYAN